MIQESILLVGAGGHARACIDVIEQKEDFIVKGLVGLPEEVGSRILDYLVLGSDEDLPTLLGDCKNALVAVGQIKTADLRIRFFNQLQKDGFFFPVIVSPHAYVSPHANLNAGTIVMHGAVVNAGAVVGENCIINTHALIEHEAIVANHCHISTGAIINGNASIGVGSFVGSASIIENGITLGSGCVVGMGLAVRHHHKDNARILTNDKP
jgi:sugar O-acyltransferase (sialic acid O-acetyltransferase NeuD family)